MECIDSQPCTQGSVSLLVPLVHSHARAQSGRSSLDREKLSCWVFIRVQALVPMFHRSVHFALPLPQVPFGPARAPDHASQAQCRPRPTALVHQLLHHERPSMPPTPTCHRVALDPGSRCYRGGTFSPFGKAWSVDSFFSQAGKRWSVWSGRLCWEQAWKRCGNSNRAKTKQMALERPSRQMESHVSYAWYLHVTVCLEEPIASTPSKKRIVSTLGLQKVVRSSQTCGSFNQV